jgi:hypothetical protein
VEVYKHGGDLGLPREADIQSRPAHFLIPKQLSHPEMSTSILLSASQPYHDNSKAIVTTGWRSSYSNNDRNYITRVTTTYKTSNDNTGAFISTKPWPPPDKCSSGNKKTIYKNSCGDIVRIVYTDPCGTTIKIAYYDSCGGITRTTYMDSDGNSTKTVYVDSGGNSTKTAYLDPNGNTYKLSYYDSKGNTSKLVYFDSKGNKIRTTYFDPKGKATVTIYVDSRGNTTKIVYYDSCGNIAMTVYYDSCGNVIKPTPTDSSSSSSSSGKSCGCGNGSTCEKCKLRKVVYKDGRGNVWKITHIDCYGKTRKTDYPDSPCNDRSKSCRPRSSSDKQTSPSKDYEDEVVTTKYIEKVRYMY